MSELVVDTSYLGLTPDAPNANDPVAIDGAGFLADSDVQVSVRFPDGSSFSYLAHTDAGGVFSSTGRDTPASAVLLSDGTRPAVDDTVVIGSRTYTFKDSIGATAGQVLRGAAAPETLANLKAAINLEDGSGTLYGSNTTIHPNVYGGILQDDSLQLVALTPGAAGNAIACSVTGTHLSVDANMSGGADSAADLLSFNSAREGKVFVEATDGTNHATATATVWHRA